MEWISVKDRLPDKQESKQLLIFAGSVTTAWLEDEINGRVTLQGAYDVWEGMPGKEYTHWCYIEVPNE